MPQSFDSVILHIVFATKHRRKQLVPSIRYDVHKYMSGIVRHRAAGCLRVGGVSDHIHIIASLGRKTSIADLVRHIKTASSSWIRQNYPDLSDFEWQRGYSVFSVYPVEVDVVLRYVDNQEPHHQTTEFTTEYRDLLRRHHLPFDESHMWD